MNNNKPKLHATPIGNINVNMNHCHYKARSQQSNSQANHRIMRPIIYKRSGKWCGGGKALEVGKGSWKGRKWRIEKEENKKQEKKV